MTDPALNSSERECWLNVNWKYDCSIYSPLFLHAVAVCVDPENYDLPDFDNNNIDRSDQISEPRRRKMSLRASVIGQPGILAGLYVFTRSNVLW